MTTSPTPASPWSGRHDGDGPEHARWHQAVQVVEAPSPDGSPVDAVSSSGAPDPAADHVALLGFRSEEGVRRNRGRVGAAEGPAADRKSVV